MRCASVPPEVLDYLRRQAEDAWLADRSPRDRAVAACVTDEFAALCPHRPVAIVRVPPRFTWAAQRGA